MNRLFDYEQTDDDEAEYYAVRPNKSKLKKDIAALFVLAEELSDLSVDQLETLALPEAAYKAILEVFGMPHKGARKRQLKFIAGQLYKIEVEPVLEKLAYLKNSNAQAVREHRVAERWRDRLLVGGDAALTELLAEYPAADGQALRQSLRNSKKEQEQGKPPRSYRLLYQQLKTLLQSEEHAGGTEVSGDMCH